MAAVSVTRTAGQASPGNNPRTDRDPRCMSAPEPAEVSDPSRKRKTSASPSNKQNPQRQKITRACDYCKGKKTRCSGTLPCVRCTRLSLPCEYNAAYSRGLPPEPLPAAPSSLLKPIPATARRPLAARAADAPGSRRLQRHSPKNSISSNHQPPKPDPYFSPRNSPEPVATDFEGNYLGPASGISFINRVWGRLRHDETSALPDGMPNESSKNASVFMFGDNSYTHYQDTGFTLPPYGKALELVGIYFDFSMVTYRFLHRGSVEEWLRQVYENNVSLSNPPPSNMVARTAVVLMIFAVATLYQELHPSITTDGHESERWYMASKYMSSMEAGPPRLETIQARLGQCLYLLSSSRANECWYSFGTAMQLVAALGLHRKWYAKMGRNGSTYLERELRKRIFWSAYTLDKYLSIMFGRPRLLHDEDIDQEFPDQANDEDMSQEDPGKRTGSPDSMMMASLLHYRLARILEEISRQFYTINPKTRDPPAEIATHLTAELEKWKESAPPLFNSVRATSLILPLRRQSQVLQLAYSHAMIHATRSFLLSDFVDPRRRKPRAPHPTVASHVRKCIEAAEGAMALVDGLGQQGILVQSFWFTHYVCFCAIMVVYIHTIQQHRLSSLLGPSAEGVWDPSRMHYLFNLAESCHQHLAEATRKNSPSRRYSIILEELRREVHRQIGSPLQPSPQVTMPEVQPKLEYKSAPMGQRSLAPATVGQQMSFDSNPASYPPVSGGLQVPGMAQEPFGSGEEDLGFLENLEGPSWFSQLDSWAFSSISNDPSALTF